MIEIIPSLPDRVMGFSARGLVTARDYRSVIIPAVDTMSTRHGRIRLLYHLGPDFSGFDTAALWQDAKIGVRYLHAWDRIAVVSDVRWVTAATRLFGFLLHGEVRTFRNNELAAARKWLTE